MHGIESRHVFHSLSNLCVFIPRAKRNGPRTAHQGLPADARDSERCKRAVSRRHGLVQSGISRHGSDELSSRRVSALATTTWRLIGCARIVRPFRRRSGGETIGERTWQRHLPPTRAYAVFSFSISDFCFRLCSLLCLSLGCVVFPLPLFFHCVILLSTARDPIQYFSRWESVQ